MALKASTKAHLYRGGILGLASGAARSCVWLYKSWGVDGPQLAPTLISLGLIAAMLALFYRMIIDAADEADPLKDWPTSHGSEPPQY